MLLQITHGHNDTCMHVNVHIHLYIRMCIHIYIYIYICVYAPTYICVCIHKTCMLLPMTHGPNYAHMHAYMHTV